MIDISTIQVKPNDSIILRFNMEEDSMDNIKLYCQLLANLYPNNPIVCLDKNVELQLTDKEVKNESVC